MSFKHPGAAAAALGLVAFAAPLAAAQTEPSAHPNSVQPETTLSITARAEVESEPDLAYLSAGVQTEAETAEAALSQNSQSMQGVFDALAEAGVEDEDMQTSNFSLQPRYDYEERRAPTLIGYTASNQLTVRVRDLDTLGETIDALVGAGGNTFSGIRFALEDPQTAEDTARRDAMADALRRAELYADAAGLEIKRIVTIDEQTSRGPEQFEAMAFARAADAGGSTPIASGQVTYSAQISVLFELE